MSSLASGIANWVWKRRTPLVLVAVAVSLVAAWHGSSYRVSNTLEAWYPEDDPELVSYREFQRNYGSDEIIVVAVTATGPLEFDSEEGIERVAELTDRLLDIEGIATVTSLVTVPESLSAARGRLLSADRRTTAFIVQTILGESFEARRHALLREIRSEIATDDLQVHLGGYGVVFDALNEASTTGAVTLILVAHLVMVGVLSFLLRQWLQVLATLAAVSIATLWTMGLYFGTGNQLNMVTMVLTTLVLVIGTADCMHIIRSIAAQADDLPQSERVTRGLSDILPPCFLTTVTTAAGFLGLTASGLPVVRQLGWFGAAGMIAAFASSVIIVTAILGKAGPQKDKPVSLLDGLARSAFELACRRPREICTAALALGLVAGWGMVQLNSDTDSIGYLKPRHQVRVDSDFIEASIGPYVPVEFLVSSSAGVINDDVLDAVWRWQKDVEETVEVGWTWSLLDALNVSTNGLPSAIGIAVLEARLDRMRRFSQSTVDSMMQGDHEMRVSFGAPIMSAKSVQALIDRIIGLADLPDGVQIAPAGYSPLYTRIVDEIVDSQVRGFAAAIVLIVVILGVAMRSWRRVLLALPANTIPVVLTLGLMGMTGIPLDVASATIASVILGLVVDDSVHLLRPAAGAGVHQSIRVATTRHGGTLLMTTLVLAAGFLVLGLADIRSIAWFGVLASFAVVVAIATDLLLLPALASLFSGRDRAESVD